MPRDVEFMHEIADSIYSIDRYERIQERDRQVRLAWLSRVTQVEDDTTQTGSSIFVSSFIHEPMPLTDRVQLSILGIRHGEETTTGGRYGRLSQTFVVHTNNQRAIDYFVNGYISIQSLSSPSRYINSFFRHATIGGISLDDLACAANTQWSIEQIVPSDMPEHTYRLGLICLGCGIGGSVDLE